MRIQEQGSKSVTTKRNIPDFLKNFSKESHTFNMLDTNVVGIIASLLFFSGLILVFRAISNLHLVSEADDEATASEAELKRARENLSRIRWEAEIALSSAKKEIEKTKAELERLRVELNNKIEQVKLREEEIKRLNEELARTNSKYKEFEDIEERIFEILEKLGKN